MSKEITLLDDLMLAKIRTLYLKGTSIKDICFQLGYKVGTWDNYYYLNKNGFRDFIVSIRKEMFLQNAEDISLEITSIQAGDNAKLLSIKQKEAEFLRETLGKDIGYSKRAESVNINLNKNEPLDEDQRKNLDKILGVLPYDNKKNYYDIETPPTEKDLP